MLKARKVSMHLLKGPIVYYVPRGGGGFGGGGGGGVQF